MDQFPQFDLTGQVALVTASGRGLGRAISLALAHAGADIALGLRDRNAHGGLPREIEALGRRCKEGDLAAWSLLFPKIWPVLVTFVHRLYHSFEQQDAEDVAQASIEAAIRAIGTFSEKGLFRAWLFGIAVRQAATFYRSSSAKKRGAQLLVPFNDFDDHEGEAKSPAEVSAENDRAAILHRAINQLAEADRDLIHLHFFGELTFREIAEARNMNPKTVCTRLSRCKERLLVALARFDLTKSDG
jgi:RNA polymerase sigma factor, sigma-70 family